jgi:hypothetical protein
LHPPAATATCNLRRCCRPRPCPCHLLTSRVNVASSRCHHLAQLLSSLLSPPPLDSNIDVASSCHHRRARSSLLSSPPPVNIDANVASSCRRHCLAQWSSSLLLFLSSSLPPVDVNVASYRPHRLAQLSLSLSSSPPPVNVAHRASTLMLHPTAATTTCNCLCPCLPPHRRSTSRINVNIASYCRHRHYT